MDHMKPRHLRIVEPGLENYTGPLGTVSWTEGLSDAPVGWLEAQRLGSNIRVEDADAGTQVTPVAPVLAMRDLPVDHPEIVAHEQMVDANGELRSAAECHTREELEAVADKKGLAGLRSIASRWGVKGRSINEVINEIIEAQERAGHPQAEA